MYERPVKRLDDPEIVSSLVNALHKAGYSRDTIESALIRQAPVDLDILADCYAKLTFASEALAAHSEPASSTTRDRRAA